MTAELLGTKLLPCGHSIGMSILQKSFRVIDLTPIMKPNGIYFYPARHEDLRVNDVILEVEGQKITSQSDLARLINEASKQKNHVELKIQRHGETYLKQVSPYYSTRTKEYKLGIVVKGFDVGIGTLTFFDPVSKKFGALAHLLNNLPRDTNRENTLVPSTVFSIDKGRPLKPGKKLGYLNRFHEFTGIIEKNCQTGIFGTLSGSVQNPYFDSPIPIGLKSQFLNDEAHIYTVVEGDWIEPFKIRIVEINSKDASNQDMKIQIEDLDLIKRTGGIILGMSGSPIIQNGKFIGAVSYLSRSNSLSGYAVSIENMLSSSGILAPLPLDRSS